MVGFISILFINKIILNDFCVFFMLGSIWIPQIIKNAINGYRNTPTIIYAICQSIHSVFIPIYNKGFQSNFLALKPHYQFVLFLILWIGIQLIFLKIQQTRPRFLIPRELRDRLDDGFYRYSTTFEDDSKLSQTSFTSGLSVRTQDNEMDQKQKRVAKRLENIQKYECIICCQELGNNNDGHQISKFAKTPCKHRFHQVCLTEWMNQKLECPICRSILPNCYEED